LDKKYANGKPLPKVETQLVRAWLARIIAKHFVQ
jgi:hypothetical protein